MSELYKKIESLAELKNETITKMCKNCNIPRSNLSELKSGRTKSLSADTLNKIADYFNVSIEYLLTGEETQKDTSKIITDDDIKFALFKGKDGVTDEMYQEVLRFVEFVKDKYEDD